MALTEQEKDDLRIFICTKGRLPFATITPSILKEYAIKSDEEIRALLAVDKATKLNNLLEAKAKIELQINELQG